MFVTLVLIGIIHICGVMYFWYWKFLWLDILSHFLGGLWVGLMTLWIASIFISKPSTVKRSNVVILSLVATLVIGIAWEIFEYQAGIAVSTYEKYVGDTILDLIMDTLGALTAGFYGFYVLKNSLKESLVSIKASITLGVVSNEK